ncbi:hypothetical protein M409DRAFT_70435 [Zasmidium cellare ATCC 36951]|uniref:Adhesin domain-containing protein n=1 Tax=Zasmidium cellare ATCC 36951 TaxID=1080233 RepID=A0A6A6C3Z8_ZASCE|nr:uncharacterized protein M409DRAFT_70435 [Zasmidium cellare ATCC 36951]KAF2160469.1 hypothetical protein M409DRAFT_70435 [Zasmidium cellare ATCC 36951]
MADTGIYEEDYDSDSSALGVDSDVESNFADSPADGYFSERPHPRETFVENSSISAAADAKARERAEERLSLPSSPTRSVEWAEAETPSANQEDAPPDYESAISSRPSTQSHQPFGQSQQPNSQRQTSVDPTNLHGNSQLGRPPEQPLSSTAADQPLFAATSVPVSAQIVTLGRSAGPEHFSDHGPQSMRDADVPPLDEESGLLTGLKSKKKQRRWRLGCCKSMSICNIILFVAIVILVIIIMGAADDRSESGKPDNPHEGNGGEDKSPKNPVIPPKDPATMPSPPSTRQCPYGEYSEMKTYDFENPQNFSFVELIESSTWVSNNIHGKITVQPAQEEQGVDIRLWVNYATTSPWKVVDSDYVKTEDSFVLQLPIMEKAEGGDSRKPCLWVNVRVDVRPGVVLDAWELSTGNLEIQVEDGLFNRKDGEEELAALQVTGPSIFNAIRGAVHVDYWSSRETEISTISGSIKGTFALLDLLSVQSQSGSININVDPRKADEKNPRPAEFIAKSNSGTVKAYFPQKGNIPERQYSSRVETTSASISGEFILGELTSIHSTSGTINAQLLPFFDRKQRSTMHTDTRSGSTHLRVLQPYYPGEGWTENHTTHKSTSTSGSIDILYPDEWSGMIDEQSTSGSLSVKGKGVRVISDGGYSPVERHLIAQKGYGGGEIGVKTTSGSVKVRFGDE